jgi:hypothetical protein
VKAVTREAFVRAARDDSGSIVVELAGGVRLYVVPRDGRDHWMHVFVVGPREEALQRMQAHDSDSEVIDPT